VVPQELVRLEGEGVWLPACTSGDHVRRRGEEFERGTCVLPSGICLRAPQLGLLASLGIAEVAVHRRLRVGLLSSGNELREPGAPLYPGQIYDANRYSLRAALRGWGLEVDDCGVLEDELSASRDALSLAASEWDVLISSGGVSVGEEDHLKQAVRELGELHLWRLAIQPGKPFAFGRVCGTPWIGLPGNPVAAMICFLQFVEPAIALLQGRVWQPLRLSALAEQQMKSRPGRTEFLRGIFHQDASGVLRVRTTGPQGSGILSSMSDANCLIEIVPAQPAIAVGERVWIHPLQGRVA